MILSFTIVLCTRGIHNVLFGFPESSFFLGSKNKMMVLVDFAAF